MKERGNLPQAKPSEPEKPLTVDEVYELIYENEANENTIERYQKHEELSYMLDDALDAEAQALDRNDSNSQQKE